MSLREQIRREILKLPCVVEKENRFGTKMSYFFEEKEFAHFHSDSQMDILKTPKVDKKDKRVEPNPYSEKWIIFNFKAEQDAKDAIELVRMAYLAVSKA
jgi:hypothetical protein